MKDVKNPFEHVRGQAVLGTETFMEKVRRALRACGVKDKAAKGSERRVRARSVAEIVSAVAKEYGVGTEKITRVRSDAAEARQAALWALAEHGRGVLSQRAIGEAMGGISASAVAHARQRQTESMQRTKRVQRRIARISKSLVNS